MLFVAFWLSWVLAVVEKCRQTFQAPITIGPGSSALFVANFSSAYVHVHTQFDVDRALVYVSLAKVSYFWTWALISCLLPSAVSIVGPSFGTVFWGIRASPKCDFNLCGMTTNAASLVALSFVWKQVVLRILQLLSELVEHGQYKSLLPC